MTGPPQEKRIEPDDNSIPHEGTDASTFSKFLAIFTANCDDYSIITITEKQQCQFKSSWNEIVKYLLPENSSDNSINSDVKEYTIPSSLANKFTNDLGLDLKISLLKKDNEKQIRGCVTSIENENSFNDWFIYHILSKTNIDRDCIDNTSVTSDSYNELFTTYFAENVKNAVQNEQWDFGGKEYFTERVKYYTDRNIPIEAVLPAFPCKSSNFDKVNGVEPDKGEELALRRIIQIIDDVKTFYPPGMKVWIISDGHVFSDCIGVDDDVVDTYTMRLHELYKSLSVGKENYIQFYGLNEIFFGDAKTIQYFNKEWTKDVEICHLTGSKINAKADLSREVLMKGCDTDDGRLKKHINTDGHARLYLYRGFSKFMSEDLQLQPLFQAMSKKKFKKTVSKVAFNMIKRNDAYSNLVELMFPHHLRFSIHAHNNAGPKYGIKVISREQCAIVKDLKNPEEPIFEDLLHIPTPWHNCIVSFEGNIKDLDSDEDNTELQLLKETSKLSVSSSSSDNLNSNEYNSSASTSTVSTIYSNKSGSQLSSDLITPLSSQSSNQSTFKQQPLYYLTRSREVKDAIEKGLYDGEWRETSFEDGIGGYYILRKRY
ncbi:hypothetical protein TPHA_0E02100 [Tetrapisispora phaffii CBS 4417]|uniref:TauD/TfdA-like domain-containing protein n=1 Tax=Tetrapisispora phaffii (strain ATCC 24235 / CBS 4417 / NBRC 1672 / NRRL Y-8282 / UCD 70-5) TaxID=1071381 RepID=G8BTS4_TETPH|nr:hypothetical protein TPHA_0E02100 [Tetrapisispora phaffii CBS 4417]CCE63302.1 hypothetical protein TPHA_0E02100 [Tetrapisispora phaffii CBS 4417]